VEATKIKRQYAGLDVKAELVAADLVQSGVALESIVIRPVGSFTRKFRNDVLKYENVTTTTGGVEELLYIDVSREGIYDALPQHLFHMSSGKKSDGIENKIEELKRQRFEESEARKFFSVFEKEFSHCRVLVELEERKSIFGLSDDFNSDLFTDIWVELKDLSKKFHKYLYQILPIAHKCRGNVHLSSILLGYVINEAVKIRVSSEPTMQKNIFAANELGERFLGADFVVGDKTPSYDSEYMVTIGPIAKGKIRQFMHGSEYEKVILYLLDYFIPFDANFKVELVLEKDAENLFLCNNENYCFLGYDSNI
jgi:hypothetical protein